MPNPTDGNATINYAVDKIKDNQVIIITSLMGNIVATYPLKNAYGQVDFNNPDLAQGVYICTLKQNDKIYGVQKFIKF
jgi:hypothetical protein